MPSIEFYVNEADAHELLDWLSSRPELAFLVPEGENRWRAWRTLSELPSVPIYLWHIPTGPLPLYLEGSNEPTGIVEDPFSGWCGRATSVINFPFFGNPPRGMFELHLNLLSKYSWSGWLAIGPNTDNTIGRSGIGWIGDRFKAIGYPADAGAKRFWSKVRSLIRERGTPLTPTDAVDTYPTSNYAFPGALAEIRN